MARLFAFGCSYTYGHGLVDCIVGKNEAGPEPSKLVYVNLIADYLNIKEVKNCAYPGKSNKWILSALETYLDLIKPDDTVILQWSFMERDCILGNEFRKNYIKSTDLGPWKKDYVSTTYYKMFYSSYNNEKTTSWYINYADFLLKHNNITKVLHTAPPGGEDIKKNIICKENYWNTCLADHTIDYAQDKNHPGPKTHQLFAKLMLEKFPWLKE
jgi:hypothetical protein